VQRISADPALEFLVSWSPDGRRIVADSCILSQPCWIAAASDDGSWGVLLSDKDDIHPVWSPDGKRIVFASGGDGNLEIYVVDVDGGNVRRLTDTPEGNELDPAWSPDGKKIVYDFTLEGATGDIWVMDTDGSNKRQLTNHPANDTNPSFSPDGTQILFQSDRDGDYEIYVMNADGSSVRQLTFNDVDDAKPSWSLDSRRILFTSDRDSRFRDSKEASERIKGVEIYIMDPDGGNVTRPTSNEAFDWAPRWAPRKRGVEVSETSVVIPNASALKPMTVQEITVKVRSAVVLIRTELGTGSGFIIDPNGFILTANHVIRDAREITVSLDDGRSFEGTVKGRDMVRDLALVKIEANNLPTLKLGDVGQVPLGSGAVVVGYSLASAQIVITEVKTSAVSSDAGRNILWVRLDRDVNPGNSGGPLFNLQGQVIGVISELREGVAFAISANTVKLYLERLKAGEVIAS
jgi:Tol biopolymer transport system component